METSTVPSKMKVSMLRSELSRRGIDSSGLKGALVKRLESSMEGKITRETTQISTTMAATAALSTADKRDALRALATWDPDTIKRLVFKNSSGSAWHFNVFETEVAAAMDGGEYTLSLQEDGLSWMAAVVLKGLSDDQYPTKLEVIEAMLSVGVDPNFAGSFWLSPVKGAAYRGFLDQLKLMRTSGAVLDADVARCAAIDGALVR